jgi:hypothetical protein
MSKIQLKYWFEKFAFHWFMLHNYITMQGAEYSVDFIAHWTTVAENSQINMVGNDSVAWNREKCI